MQTKGQTNKQADSDCSALFVEISPSDYSISQTKEWSADGGGRRKERQGSLLRVPVKSRDVPKVEGCADVQGIN